MEIEDLIKKHADCLDWKDASKTIDMKQIDDDVIHQFSYLFNITLVIFLQHVPSLESFILNNLKQNQTLYANYRYKN